MKIILRVPENRPWEPTLEVLGLPIEELAGRVGVFFDSFADNLAGVAAVVRTRHGQVVAASGRQNGCPSITHAGVGLEGGDQFVVVSTIR